MTAARPALERSALPACCHSLTCTHTHRPCAHTHPSHIHTAHTPQTHRPTHTPLPRDALYLTYVATSPAHTDPLEPAGARGRRVHAPCSSTPQPQTHRQGGGRLRRHLPENLLPTEPETSLPRTLCRVTGRLQRGILSGPFWVTFLPPTPGSGRLWRCEAEP